MQIVHTINLDKREDRLLSVSKQAKQQGFALKIWRGEEGNIPYKNINKSFRKIVQFAKDNGDEYTIIMEDDCIFHSFQSFDYFMKNMPGDFDLYLGMIYSGTIEDNRVTNGYSGNTLICIHNNFYDEFLSAPPDVHYDRWCGLQAFKRKYFVCQPFVCRQMNGFSDNRRENSCYDAFLIGKEFI